MERVKNEPLGLCCRDLADVFVGCEPLESLQATSKVVRLDEVVKVGLKLAVSLVVIAFDGCFLDRAIHSLDLTIRPRMLDLGQSMLDAVLPACAAEDMLKGIAIPRTICELDAVVCQYRVETVGNGLDEVLQKPGGLQLSCLWVQFSEGKLAGAVDRHEQIQLPLGCLHFGNVDMEVADWIALEQLLYRLGAFDFRQPGHAMTLQAAMQRRSRQMWNCRLQGIKAVVERQ